MGVRTTPSAFAFRSGRIPAGMRFGGRTMAEGIRLGVSACLLGRRVRYDGGHKRDAFLADTLGKFAEYVPVCPETECGLGVPREPMRLVGDPSNPRLVTVETGVDHAARLKAWAAKRLHELAKAGLCGFVFKSRSPSCGMERVKVHGRDGTPSRNGRGLFAAAFTARFPALPVEDEGRLGDPAIRDSFIERVFAMRRWREARRAMKRGALVEFHARNQLLLLAHSPKHHRDLGRLVAAAKSRTPKDLFDAYESLLFEALALKATRAKHANVLQHMLRYLEKVLSADPKREALDRIEKFRAGLLPRVVPVTLIHRFVRSFEVDCLARQTYFDPYPVELRLHGQA
jgi:uncharacterized protein YbgA (DUF1722 family)/uncharacterized protein YbbK (DUF523 family)